MKAAHQGVPVAALPGQSGPRLHRSCRACGRRPARAWRRLAETIRSRRPRSAAAHPRSTQPEQQTTSTAGCSIGCSGGGERKLPHAARAECPDALCVDGSDARDDAHPHLRCFLQASPQARSPASRAGTRIRVASALSGMTRWPPSSSSSARSPARPQQRRPAAAGTPGRCSARAELARELRVASPAPARSH